MLHINVLELKSVKLAPLTFNKQKSLKAIHFEIDNTTALLYLVKMGGNREPNVIEIKQRNWAVSLETRDNNYYRLEAAGTHRNGNFAQKYFNKSVRAGE